MNKTSHFKRSPSEYGDHAGFCLISILGRAKKRKAVFVNFVAIQQVVDFRSRMLAFRGAGGEPPQLRLRGLTFPLIPQESRTLRSNQPDLTI
ncbi:hypothetical protein [Bacillus sp. MUM 13]|uniref:hypothetical protein n=1 Tax=Bacillus sp. MUM 13 TaxID=1678001 RepID=UPI0008F58C79|nr:hypothetical protein [Bacillus sp. MUM 13]OIK13612.1 hypothetical protein BIV59_05190 [Bacillus sp. MUM 13]